MTRLLNKFLISTAVVVFASALPSEGDAARGLFGKMFHSHKSNKKAKAKAKARKAARKELKRKLMEEAKAEVETKTLAEQALSDKKAELTDIEAELKKRAEDAELLTAKKQLDAEIKALEDVAGGLLESTPEERAAVLEALKTDPTLHPLMTAALAAAGLVEVADAAVETPVAPAAEKAVVDAPVAAPAAEKAVVEAPAKPIVQVAPAGHRAQDVVAASAA